MMNFCLIVQQLQKAGHSFTSVIQGIEIFGKQTPDDARIPAYIDAFARVKEVGFDDDLIKNSLLKTEPKGSDFSNWSQDAVNMLLQ